jgi:phospholipase A2
MKKFLSHFSSILTGTLLTLTLHVQSSAHSMLQKPIFVRQNNTLCDQELITQKNRMPEIKAALEMLLNQQLNDNQVPRIAIASSGGGYRSMIATLGGMLGLEKTGILNTCMYFSTISGSTWMNAPMLARNESLTEFRSFLKQQTTKNLYIKDFDLSTITSSIIKKASYNQYVNLADLWGGLLADLLLEGLPNQGQDVFLSSLAPKIQSGNHPIPLFSSIIDNTKPYTWVEFSPFEIGSQTMHAWVPTSAFGKKFEKGTSTDAAPEVNLGFLLGMWGSAYASNFRDILKEIFTKIEEIIAPPSNEIRCCGLISDIFNTIGEGQLPPPTVFNPVHGMTKHLHADRPTISLIDPGVCVNIAFPPLLRRNVDLYIVFDCTDNVFFNEMRNVQKYASDNGFKLPKIPPIINADPVSIFVDENDPSLPIIIYLRNQVNYSTFKYEYTNQEFETLCTHMQTKIEQAQDKIVQAIKKSVENKTKLMQ